MNPVVPTSEARFHSSGEPIFTHRTMKHLLIAIASIAFVSASCSSPEDSSVTADSSATAYPLDTCLVSEERLGSMGDPVTIIHEGQEIKFCCEACVPEFKADPARFLPRLEQQSLDN